jgi:phage/plasmid-associated DNA primase
MERKTTILPRPDGAGPQTLEDETAGGCLPPAFGDDGPGPSPAETDAFAWAAIDEVSQRKRCAGARNLNNFVRDVAHVLVTPKGDQRTNIIDQGERVTYAFDRDNLRTLFRHLEACRLEGSIVHFSERQGTPAVPRCGLMIDFDLFVSNRRPVLTDRHYYRLAGALVAALQRDIDFAAQLPAANGRPAVEARLHVFFIIKPEALPCRDPAAAAEATAFDVRASAQAPQRYKYGLHILVPGVKLSRAYKKWFLRQFAADPAVAATLAELDVIGDPAKCLDQNSASVPVLFFGSCKRGAVPYVLGAALEVVADVGCSGGWSPPPVIRRLEAKDLAGYNLAAELSLVGEAEYDGREPLVRKLEFEPRPDVAVKAQDWGERSQGGLTPAEELLDAEHGLSTLTLHDPEARTLHALLDILGEEYYTDRNKWRDVVYALANTSEKYKPLATWFSQKCRHRSRPDARTDDLDSLWDDAVARRGAVASPLTAGSIDHWAKTSSPEQYAKIKGRSFFTLLTGYVYDHGGKLQHYMFAKTLHAMLGPKFCVDIDAGARGAQTYCWFEFVVPGQDMKPGEIWKWRKEVEPDAVHIYMSEQLTRVLDQINDHIEEKRLSAADEEHAKYYRNLGKNFATSRLNVYNDTFKNGIIRQANYLFRRRGFVDSLDRDPALFGTLNGVLRVGPRLQFINYYHEFPISIFSPVAWVPFDPEDPWQRLVLNAIADIIPEPDARDWIIFHACQGISGEMKEGLMLMWEGGGQNGKTSVLRWFAEAIGPKAAKFNIQLMCCEREDADRPNSAMMRFEHLNWAYAEESNKAQALNVARMKEMVNAGKVSGRDLNAKQKEFTMKANIVAASQYSFLVDTTDHGTWRRLRWYKSKVKFCKNPDLSNPFEKKDDQRFIRQYPDDPQFKTAVLAVLGHYYERLQNEYGGELKNVRAPTIERETETFRISQDALHRWICESIVLSPECEAEYPLGVLGGYFTEWYTTHIDRKRHVASEVIKEIEASALGKHMKPAPNRTRILKGCRVLTADEQKLRPGEEFLSEAEMRGGRTSSEWAEACAEADAALLGGRTDGRPWWAARSPETAVERDGEADDELFAAYADEAVLLRTDRQRRTRAGQPAAALDDEDIDAILAGDWAAAPRAADVFSLDDVYAV